MLNRVASQQPAPPIDPESVVDPLESSSGEGLRQAALAAAAAIAPIEQLQKKLRKLVAEIEGKQRQLREIEQTIKVKQNIIAELVRNSDTRSHAKQRFHKKRAKLEAECDKAKKQLGKALVQGREQPEIERWTTIIAHLERRLEDLSSMKHIAGESGQKVKKLQQSVAESRKQADDLEKKLRKEGKLRCQMEAELDKLRESRDTGKELVKAQTDSPEHHGRQLKAVQARITHLNHILREKSDNLEEQPLPAHTLFTLTLEQQWVSKEGMLQHRLSTASFSDLCGTERFGEPPPGRPRDAGLHMLEQVISTLTDPGLMYGVNGKIPYGQTTLTTLLKD